MKSTRDIEGFQFSRGKRAAVSRPLLVCTLGSLVVLLWLMVSLFGGHSVPGAVDAGADAGERARADASTLADSEAGGQRAVGGAQLVQAPGELAIPVGVRLAGQGRLEGVVRERASGAGVPGVRVDLHVVPPAGIELVGRIYHLARFGEKAAQRFRPVATAATARDGSFVFEGIRAGDYFLEPRGAWHVPDNLALVSVAPSGAGGPVDVWVRSGGRVLGQVLNPDGRPASGADVWCFPGPGTILRRLREGDVRGLKARADGDGRYVIHGVPPGEGFEVSALSGSATITHVPNVTVVAGGDTQVDVVLRAGSHLAGRVLSHPMGEPAMPLGGARVSVLPRGLRDLHFARELLKATQATTAADGTFLSTRVPGGEVDVIAWAPDHLHGMLGGITVPEGGEVQAGDLELIPGVTVRVHVTDDTGQPLEGVQASWWTADWNSFRFRFGFTPFLLQAVEGFDYPSSDAEGNLLAGPFPGSPPFQMAFYKAGYSTSLEEWSPEEESDLEVKLTRGGTIEGIVMDLGTGQPVPRFTLETASRLESDPASPSGWNPYSGGVLFEDKGGRFHLEGLEAGTVELRIRTAEHFPKSVSVDVVAGEITRGVIVNLQAGGQVRGHVLDGEGQPVRGATVLATDKDGVPVRGWPKTQRTGSKNSFARQNQKFGMDMLAVAHTLGSVGPGSVLSDEEGAFVLHSVPPGPVYVRGWQREFARGQIGPVTVPGEGALEGLELVLREGGAIEGRVSDRHGRPVPDAIVIATRPDSFKGTPHGDHDVYQGQSGPAGRYRIEHMPQGSYFLFLTRGNAALDPLAFLGTMNFDLVRVPSETRVTYDLIDTSAAGTHVFGNVSSGGRSVQGGTLFALSFAGANLFGVDAKVAEVESDGSYSFPGLEPGDYQFRYGGKAAEVVLDVEVLDQPSQRVDLALPEGGLAGRVVSAETGEGIAKAEVLVVRPRGGAAGGGLFGEILSAEGGRVSAFSDARGAFQIERLQEGPWEVVVNPPRWGPDRDRYAPTEARSLEIVEGTLLDDFEIALEPALSVSGVVLDELGQVVARALVSAYPQAGGLINAPESKTDSEGRFRLVGLSAGSWVLGASKAGFADAPPEELHIEEGAPPDVAIVLPRGVQVSIRVLGPDGEAAPGATARLIRLEGEAIPEEVALRRSLEGVFKGQGIAGSDGWIDLGQKAPGRYSVEALRGGRSGRLDEIRVESGLPARFEIRLE